MKTAEATTSVVTSKRHSASPATTKRPRVRKLLPLAPHQTAKAPPPPPPPLSPAKSHVDVLGHLRAEADRLRKLMGVAVAARDLKQVEAIMEHLLSLVEREPRKNDDERRFNEEVLAYLDVCEADLKALVQQEERERKHQRFAANALMQQATALLHGSSAGSVDEAAVLGLLDQAEHAYRRARDKRADCIPAIRHRVAAEATLTRATHLFDEGNISAAIAMARSASDEYAAYRASPSYQGSQILLSLSEPSDVWEEAPLRDLGHAHDNLDRCFANVDEFFRDKARSQTKSLFADSKRLADEKRFAEARNVVTRCDAVYVWLAEPVPLALTKWKRQLARLELCRELQQLDKATQRDTMAQLLKWARECDAGTIQREDLVECGVGGFALKMSSSGPVPQDDPSIRELAAAVFTLVVERMLPPGTVTSTSALRQLADLKTVITAMLQLAETLDSDQNRVRVLHEVAGQLDTKQATHVAIHKCDILPRWTRLRDAHNSAPDVLVALLDVLHRLLVTGFPTFSTLFIESKVVRGAVSTMARHYKHFGVASGCLEILTTVCTAREHCVGMLLAPGDAGLSGAITQALRHYTQQQALPPTPQTRALVVGLTTVVSTLCELDLAFSKAVDASKVPSLVFSLGPNPPWHIPAELTAFFEPRQFSRSVRDSQLPKRASSRPLLPKSVPEPTETIVNPHGVARICLVRFGASVQVARRRQFCVVRFLVPDALAPRADQCRLEVTALQTRVQTQVYAFPRDGVYSVAVLRRELMRWTPARAEFFRTLVASLQPIVTVK